MKLRNKKTGEIAPASNIAVGIGKDGKWYESLAELNEEWEDYDDTKDHWCINFHGEAKRIVSYADREEIAECKQIGNYFETREEAEKAVEKLKAWKRLKDKGFRFIPEFHRIEEGNNEEDIISIACTMDDVNDFIYGDNKDLKLLFGGEE